MICIPRETTSGEEGREETSPAVTTVIRGSGSAGYLYIIIIIQIINFVK